MAALPQQKIAFFRWEDPKNLKGIDLEQTQTQHYTAKVLKNNVKENILKTINLHNKIFKIVFNRPYNHHIIFNEYMDDLPSELDITQTFREDLRTLFYYFPEIKTIDLLEYYDKNKKKIRFRDYIKAINSDTLESIYNKKSFITQQLIKLGISPDNLYDNYNFTIRTFKYNINSNNKKYCSVKEYHGESWGRDCQYMGLFKSKTINKTSDWRRGRNHILVYMHPLEEIPILTEEQYDKGIEQSIDFGLYNVPMKKYNKITEEKSRLFGESTIITEELKYNDVPNEHILISKKLLDFKLIDFGILDERVIDIITRHILTNLENSIDINRIITSYNDTSPFYEITTEPVVNDKVKRKYLKYKMKYLELKMKNINL
jgi:hypothetical protein